MQGILKKISVVLLSLVLLLGTYVPVKAEGQKTLTVPTPINQVFPDPILAGKMVTVLGKSTVTDLVSQNELDALTSVEVSMSQGTPPENNYKSIEGFQYIHNATSVSIGGSAVTDLGPLGTMTEVKNLTLAASTVVDITPLKNLKNLEYIYGSYTDIKDLSPLSELTKLKILTLFNIKAESAKPLENLTLENLTLVAFVKDLSPIANIKTLTWLNVRGNGLTDPRIFNGLTNLTSLQLTNQRVTLDKAVLNASGNLTITSPVVDSDGNIIDAINISDGGTYSDGKVSWTGLPVGEPMVQYAFSKNVTVNGLTTQFSGTVDIPLEFDIVAPVIDSNPEVSYVVDSTITESQCLADLQAKTDDGSPITSDFDSAVDFTKVGTYDVILNSTDVAGNKAIPVTVQVHITPKKIDPVITCDQEITYKLGTQKTLNAFLEDIHASVNDGYTLGCDFLSSVKLNQIGDYTVVINALDGDNKTVLERNVIVHVVDASTPGDTSNSGVISKLPKTGGMMEIILLSTVNILGISILCFRRRLNK